MDVKPMRLMHYIWAAWVPAWTFDPPIVVGLMLSAFFYVTGIVRANRPLLSVFRVLRFALGGLCLVVALVSHLHELVDYLFSAHMAQHELLMAIAAPLLVLGRADLA